MGGLPEGCVLIADEAAMAETRVLAPILAAVEQAGGKAILIGDPQQLPAVGAGGLFAAIVERHGAFELRENQRQRDELEQRALRAVRDGRGRDYLAFAEQRGRLVVSHDPLESRARIVGDWWRHARTDLAGNVMLAHRRADVAELNALARTLMNEEGRLGEEHLLAAGRELRAGDRIICRRNADTLGVRNGTRGTIISIDPERRTLTFASDRGEQLELSAGYLEAGHVEHAYALTGHAAQGLTVERAFVLGADRGRLQEWGYVALSRASETTRLYITGAQAERDNHFQQLDDREPLTRLAEALEQPGAERLAHDNRRPPPRPEPRVASAARAPIAGGAQAGERTGPPSDAERPGAAGEQPPRPRAATDRGSGGAACRARLARAQTTWPNARPRARLSATRPRSRGGEARRARAGTETGARMHRACGQDDAGAGAAAGPRDEAGAGAAAEPRPRPLAGLEQANHGSRSIMSSYRLAALA